jgi:hypothetical protein
MGSRGRQVSLRSQILERHGLKVVGECDQQATADLNRLHGSLFFFSSVEVLFVQVVSMLVGFKGSLPNGVVQQSASLCGYDSGFPYANSFG